MSLLIPALPRMNDITIVIDQVGRFLPHGRNQVVWLDLGHAVESQQQEKQYKSKSFQQCIVSLDVLEAMQICLHAFVVA